MGQITRDDEQLSIRTAVGSGCELHICSLNRYVLYVFAYSGSEAITSAKAACGSSRVIGPRSCPCASATLFRRVPMPFTSISQTSPGTSQVAGFRNPATPAAVPVTTRSEEHTSELQSLMRISYAVFCLKKKKT